MRAPKHRYRVVNVRRTNPGPGGLEIVEVSTHTTIGAAEKARAKQFTPYIQQWDVHSGNWQRLDQM